MCKCQILLFQKKTGSCLEVRLNTPHGKYKITNMADDQVDLAPENIPGASNEKELLDHPASSHRTKDWKRH